MTGEMMRIRKEIWLVAVSAIRHDAAMYLSCTNDIQTVFTALDSLEEETPPRVKHMFGVQLQQAKKYVIEHLQESLKEKSIQLWLDEVYTDLMSESFDNE